MILSLVRSTNLPTYADDSFGNRNGPALNNTYFVDGSKSTPPFHHKHHMHLQHINLKLETTIEEVIIYPK